MLTRSVAVSVALSCVIQGSLASQQLSGCGPRAHERIESFTVTLPTTMDRAYSSTVQAFMTLGFLPSRTWWRSNEVQWESLADEDFFDGARRTRSIRAVLFETASGTIIHLSARERVRHGDPKSRIQEIMLSNRNHGTGYKVWCGTRQIADSLQSIAAREPRSGEQVASRIDVESKLGRKLMKRELWPTKVACWE